jgi:hypothetical protein
MISPVSKGIWIETTADRQEVQAVLAALGEPRRPTGAPDRRATEAGASLVPCYSVCLASAATVVERLQRAVSLGTRILAAWVT